MEKSTLALAALGLAAFMGQPGDGGEPLQFKAECMLLEFSPEANQVVLLLEAESEEALDRIELRDPHGLPLLKLWSAKSTSSGLSGLKVETVESAPKSLMVAFPEGLYDLRARTPAGQVVAGSAALSHDLLAEPVVTFPLKGSSNVPRNGLLVTWVPDPKAAGYHVVLEQDENDGLSAKLPAGASKFQVPDRLLKAGTETKLEVGAIGPNGNITLAEVSFTTL